MWPITVAVVSPTASGDPANASASATFAGRIEITTKAADENRTRVISLEG